MVCWSHICFLVCCVPAISAQPFCNASDPLQNRSEDEIEEFGIGHFSPVCERTGDGYHLGDFVYMDPADPEADIQTYRTTVTYMCYNGANHEVVKGNENLVNTGFGRALILTSDLIVSGTTCEFKGCYGKYTSGYFLMEDIQPCYIDFNECEDAMTNGCHANANCTNNETGTYSCGCNFDGGYVYVGNDIDCYDIGPPSLDSPNLAETVLNEGNDLTLVVSIMYEYLPLTNVFWASPDGADVTNDTSINSTLPASAGPVAASLHLSDLSPGDSGVYAVTATNDAGNTTLNFTVMVLPGPPSLDSPNLAETILNEGNDLTLVVSIMYEYLPLTNVSWASPDGDDVTTDTSINSTLPAGAGPVAASLHLSDLSPGDSGVYAVTATNDAGNTTLNFIVIVLPGPDEPESLPLVFGAIIGMIACVLFLCFAVAWAGVTVHTSRKRNQQNKLKNIHRGVGVFIAQEEQDFDDPIPMPFFYKDTSTLKSVDMKYKTSVNVEAKALNGSQTFVTHKPLTADSNMPAYEESIKPFDDGTRYTNLAPLPSAHNIVLATAPPSHSPLASSISSSEEYLPRRKTSSEPTSSLLSAKDLPSLLHDDIPATPPVEEPPTLSTPSNAPLTPFVPPLVEDHLHCTASPPIENAGDQMLVYALDLDGLSFDFPIYNNTSADAYVHMPASAAADRSTINTSFTLNYI